VREEGGELREEEEGGGGDEEGEDGGEGDGDAQERPSHVSRCAADALHEGDGKWEVGVEAYALDAVREAGDVGGARADFGDDAASAIGVVDYASVDGGLTDEAVAAIYRCSVRGVGRSASDHERLVDDLLCPDGARIQHFVAAAGGRAAEGQRAVVEGPAEGAVESAAVARGPVGGAAGDGRGRAVAFYVRCEGRIMESQSKR